MNIETKYIDYKNNDWGYYNLNPTCIVIHNTANSASAENEYNYLNGRTGGYATYHYVCDENVIIHTLPNSVNAWATADGTVSTSLNRTGIHIEVARSTGGDHDGAYANMIQLVAKLCEDFGFTPNTSTIKFHVDAGTKYCPHKILDDAGSTSKARTQIIDKVNRILNESEKEIDDMITWEEEVRARALIGTNDNARFTGDKRAKFVKDTNVYVDITCDTRNASQSVLKKGQSIDAWSQGWQTRKSGAKVLVYKFTNSAGNIYYTIVDQK